MFADDSRLAAHVDDDIHLFVGKLPADLGTIGDVLDLSARRGRDGVKKGEIIQGKRRHPAHMGHSILIDRRKNSRPLPIGQLLGQIDNILRMLLRNYSMIWWNR